MSHSTLHKGREDEKRKVQKEIKAKINKKIYNRMGSKDTK
jgi:hypothetical protein